MTKNLLYYGDNLQILRDYIKDETIDLVYLDPPFKSSQDYNVLFAEQNGSRSAAQIHAFEDTWRWDTAAAEAYRDIVERGGKPSQVMQAFHTFLGESDMLAYLAMMAPRLIELHRVLKDTGSIYLHCDPTASHYLKMLMDAVFGAENFRNEVIWKRTDAKGNVQKKYGWIHDRLLFYTKMSKWVWNQQYAPYDPEYVEQFYNKFDEHGRRYQATDLTAPMSRASKGQVYSWKGYTPPPSRCFVYNKEKMLELEKRGRIEHTKGGCPRYIRYLDEMKGNKCPDIWADIKIAQKSERLGYPTQKPEALLERIVKASSKEGDLVLDPFCGCGTTIAVAQKLKRRWIGIDITHLAVALMKHRLEDMFGEKIRKTYEVVGEPTDLSGAKQLAKDDPYQFQWWALGLVGARPVEQKKGADKGIDGRLYFHDEADSSKAKTKQIIISVKAGHVSVPHIRDLRGVIERENAQIGVLISMDKPTKPMRTEAASAGFYKSPWQKEPYPKIQILTIEELLNGKRIDCPPLGQVNVTFKKAPKAKGKTVEQPELEYPLG